MDISPDDTTGPAPDPAVQAASLTSRTVQFRAPGGTRVIWTLNPNLTLPDVDA